MSRKERKASRGMRAFLLVVAACSMLEACAGQKLRPAAEIMSRQLGAGVDSETIFKMVAFAAKDRVCAAREQQEDRSKSTPAGFPQGTPIPAVEHGLYATYSSCMVEESITACSATEQDLRSVHTLLDRDPRLSALVSFDALLVQIEQQCPGLAQLAANAKALSSWSTQALWRCEDRYQPVLLTTAVLLRTRPPRDAEARFSWSGGCRGTAGYIFTRQHCATFERLRPPEQGVEAYFCPQIRTQFDS